MLLCFIALFPLRRQPIILLPQHILFIREIAIEGGSAHLRRAYQGTDGNIGKGLLLHHFQKGSKNLIADIGVLLLIVHGLIHLLVLCLIFSETIDSSLFI